jgi:hypothetical protein
VVRQLALTSAPYWSLVVFGKVIPDKTNDKKPIRLPDEMYGQLFIFRVFKNISYGLVMQVTDVVNVGDIVRTPEK